MLDQALEAADKNRGINTGSSTPGAMHDGSKRRLTPSSSSEGPGDESFSMVDFSIEQSPLPPKAGYKEEKHAEISLPEGIESVSHWGKTLCTLPKCASLKLTYEKMVIRADTSQEIKDYLFWVKNNSEKSAKIKDLKDYLEITGFYASQKVGTNYPGTSMIREFGS